MLVLASCSIEDSNPAMYIEFVPIESVDLPEQFVHGETYDISMTYVRPNICYVFRDFYYIIDGHVRTVAIENTVYPDGNCVEDPESVTVSFEFPVTGTETYVFKFYQGKDEEGIDNYHLVEVPVMVDRSSFSEVNPTKNGE